jgi:hypothetical protein
MKVCFEIKCYLKASVLVRIISCRSHQSAMLLYSSDSALSKNVQKNGIQYGIQCTVIRQKIMAWYRALSKLNTAIKNEFLLTDVITFGTLVLLRSKEYKHNIDTR